jgi:hypothetical protein
MTPPFRVPKFPVRHTKVTELHGGDAPGIEYTRWDLEHARSDSIRVAIMYATCVSELQQAPVSAVRSLGELSAVGHSAARQPPSTLDVETLKRIWRPLPPTKLSHIPRPCWNRIPLVRRYMDLVLSC